MRLWKGEGSAQPKFPIIAAMVSWLADTRGELERWEGATRAASRRRSLRVDVDYAEEGGERGARKLRRYRNNMISALIGPVESGLAWPYCAPR